MQETRPIRPGEDINIEELGRYLTKRLPRGESTIEIQQFPAGSSNLTYLVRFGSDEFVLRRPPFGNTVKTAHDMRREFDVLAKLSPVYSAAPKPLLFCGDASVIGSEFYLMERRRGLIIRGVVPESSVPEKTRHHPETSQTNRQAVCGAFIQNLADLHALDYESIGLGDLGKPVGYNRRQVEGWTKRYAAAKTHEWRELESSIAWLNENIPAESGASLVHNDYKFDNIMLDAGDLTKITAVLDWEMVTVGDPLMDLGTTLAYWMSKDAGAEMLDMPFNPRVLMENISRAQLVEMYTAAAGRDVSNILFYYVFGTFKIAVIAQQIYARYVKGFTNDVRFASFDSFVKALGAIAASSIQRKSL